MSEQQQDFVDFGTMLRWLEEKPLVNTAYRQNWNGKGQYICLQTPDENSANTLPYIFIVTVQGQRVPWLASQTDLLSKDWNLTIVD